jgi:hypothetical protein
LYVPRKEPVGVLLVWLQRHRQQISRSVPDAGLLIDELVTEALSVTAW